MSLAFQEGKIIDGEYVLVSIFKEASELNPKVIVAVYELETSQTHQIAFTPTEFDSLFRFNAELLNPQNIDGRFHWVVERLDFVQGKDGTKKLAVGREPNSTYRPTLGPTPSSTAGTSYASLVEAESEIPKIVTAFASKIQLERSRSAQRLLAMDREVMEKLEKDETAIQQRAKRAAEAERQKSETLKELEAILAKKERDATIRLMREREREKVLKDSKQKSNSITTVLSSTAENAVKISKEQQAGITHEKRLTVEQERREIALLRSREIFDLKRAKEDEERVRIALTEESRIRRAEALQRRAQEKRAEEAARQAERAQLEAKRRHQEGLREALREQEEKEKALAIKREHEKAEKEQELTRKEAKRIAEENLKRRASEAVAAKRSAAELERKREAKIAELERARLKSQEDAKAIMERQALQARLEKLELKQQLADPPRRLASSARVEHEAVIAVLTREQQNQNEVKKLKAWREAKALENERRIFARKERERLRKEAAEAAARETLEKTQRTAELELARSAKEAERDKKRNLELIKKIRTDSPVAVSLG